MTNFRKAAINLLFRLTGSRVPRYLREMHEMEHWPTDQIEQYQQAKLKRLLLHSFENVPYYRDVLGDCHVVVDGRVQLEHFPEIPVLTKDIISHEGQRLYSRDYRKRHYYSNSSGGSTGQPVRFIQDREHDAWNTATKIYYKKTLGRQDIGQRELRLWGSERDLQGARENLRTRLAYWLYNRREFNAFRMTPHDMARFVERYNHFRPTWIEAYVQALTEWARFIRDNNLTVHTPKGIVVSAGTLYPEMRQLIEDVFGCNVFNRYGSREVGAVACSCDSKNGLHISVWNAYLEVLDTRATPVTPGKMGNIHITTLNNFSMPLIRYDIGDMAIAGSCRHCDCGRNLPLLQEVVGRNMEVFKTRSGRIVSAVFFIHFVGVVYNTGAVERFQVVQEDYDRIIVRVVVLDAHQFAEAKQPLVDAIKKAMGADCTVQFDLVDRIDPEPSGKYLYTVSKVQK